MEDLIIIIPSHKRQNYLKRVSWYYSRFRCPVYICDSTPGEAAKLEEYENINYLHVPELGFYDKILYVLDTTDAKYYALSPDDDFLKQETLLECLDKMKLNARYSLSVGAQVFWNEGFEEKEFKYLYGSNQLRNRKIEGARLRRYSSFWPHYQNVLWSLFTKDVLQVAFMQLKNNTYKNQNFIELTLGDVAIDKGWVYVSKKALNFREVSTQEHWGQKETVINRVNIKNDISLKEDVKRYFAISGLWRRIGTCFYVSSISGIIYFFRRIHHFIKYRLLKKTEMSSFVYKDEQMVSLISGALHKA